MLDDAIARLRALDATLAGPQVTRALALDLDGRAHLLAGRTDPAVARLRAVLVELIVRPHLPTSSGCPSPAARRRAERAGLCFDEGYLVGRIGLDTHRVTLRWSGGIHHDLPTALGALRALALHPTLADAYTATARLAALVADLSGETRGIPADQAGQFAGLGLLTAVAEWTLVLDGQGPRQCVDRLLATC